MIVTALVLAALFSERRMHERAILERELRLEDALRAGGVITFDWNLRTGLIGLSPNAAELLYGAALYIVAVDMATLFHAFGHILGGKLVRSPMDELLFTATRGVNIYHGDQSAYPSRVHLGRALGGPLFNLLIASAQYLVLPLLTPGWVFDLVASIASTNLFFGVFAFMAGLWPFVFSEHLDPPNAVLRELITELEALSLAIAEADPRWDR